MDDTDGPQGGCTTYLAVRLLDQLGPEAVAGPPRLVRLDPDNPWKTRGNAAVVLDLADDLDPEEVLDDVVALVREHARLAEGKGAGLAAFDEPPAEAWYTKGMHERVGLDEARAALREVPTRTLGTGRGLVGCLCAAAWRPRRATYTRLAYREPDRRGTDRAIDRSAVRDVQREAEHVFDAWDETNEHALVAPRTPCPVLVGLRATEPEGLAAHVEAIAEEPVERARTFVSNQASDDHLAASTLRPLAVEATADVLEGGHVRLRTRTPRGRRREVMAFEPTGDLRRGLRAAEPSDTVLALGSLTKEGRQVNAEKLLHVPAQRRNPPRCPGCGRAMRSAGAQAGYRCPACGTRRPGQPDEPEACWYEADASARRHLARPLALGLADHIDAAARACPSTVEDAVAQAPKPGT